MTRTFLSCLLSKGVFPFVVRFFALLLLCTLQSRLQAQCANDTIPPVAVCVSQIVVAIGSDNPNDCFGPVGYGGVPPAEPGAGVAWMKASALNNGSYDDCNNIKFAVRRASFSECINDLNPLTITFEDAPKELFCVTCTPDSFPERLLMKLLLLDLLTSSPPICCAA